MLSSLRKTSIQRFSIVTSKAFLHHHVLKPFSSLHIPQIQQETKIIRAAIVSQQRFAYIQTRQLYDLKQKSPSTNAEKPKPNNNDPPISEEEKRGGRHFASTLIWGFVIIMALEAVVTVAKIVDRRVDVGRSQDQINLEMQERLKCLELKMDALEVSSKL